MTISSETRKAGPFYGNGVTTSFPFTFKTFAGADVKVIYTDADAVETVLVLDSDYTIALNEDQNANPGGTVSYSTLITGEKLTLLGNVEYTQETDIQNQGGFYPEVIENALDKLTMQVQQVKEQVDRAVKVDASSSVLPTDYLTQASAAANSASASASAASASESAALVSANAAAASADDIVGFEWASSWLTGTAYLKNNLVSESGNTYIALSSHTSGTFSTDYGNGLWAIFASKGAAGAGTGDLLAANNLSEVNPNTARSNLSAAKSGANSDITSLAGLTTALSTDQGGTGLTAPGTAGNVLTSDGTDWVSSPVSAAGGLIGYQIFTSNGTYTKATNNPSFVIVEVVGGGSGGSGNTSGLVSQGGAGGGYCYKKILAASLSASETVTIGAGGALSTSANGAAGGTTSFGTHCSATGGAAGGQTGGLGINGDMNKLGGKAISNFISGSTEFSFGISNGLSLSPVANSGCGGGGGSSGGVGSAAGGGSNGAAGKVIVWEYR